MGVGAAVARDTDRDWRVLGDAEPYWAVVTHEKYRAENLTEEAVREFYETGRPYVEWLLGVIRGALDADFAPRSALDFGCGVGRVLAPLADLCEEVVGVDVAEGMLTRARARCESLGLANVRVEKSDDSLAGLTGTFGLIHSFIVFQHIPPRRGMTILRKLIGLLGERGVGVLHFGYLGTGEPAVPAGGPFGARLKGAVAGLARRIGGPLLSRVRPRVDRTGPAPVFTYDYDLNLVFAELQRAGIRRMHVEYTDHAGCLGVILFFQRVPGAEYGA
jgi:SAM-dependent methyltransferase